jgi:N-acetylneuraminic acid mutarotase
MSPKLSRTTFAFHLALSVALLAALGCGEDAQSPTDPTVAPEAAPEFAIGSNTWLKRADMPGARSGFAVASLENAAGQTVVYVIGGRAPDGTPLSRVQAYNVATNTWSTKASTISALFYPNGAAVIGGKIYVTGGTRDFYNEFDALIVYDPAKNTWVHKRSMPGGGYEGVSGVIDNKLYVVYGCLTGPCRFRRYDPATDLWTILPEATGQHVGGVAGVIGNKLYVTGGLLSYLDPAKLEVYDPATNAWTTKASMPFGTELSAAAVVGGRLHVIGGYAYNSDGSVKQSHSHLVYDPALDRWLTRTSLPAGAGAIGGAAKVFVNGRPRIEMVSSPASGNNWQYTP